MSLPQPESHPDALRTEATEDPHLQALLQPQALEHFHAVVHTPDIHVPDPYDVATIHADAREAYRGLVDRARDPARATGGRSLLMLGALPRTEYEACKTLRQAPRQRRCAETT